MKTVIFHNDAGEVIRWVITKKSSLERTPRGLRRLVLDYAVSNPGAYRVEGGELVPAGVRAADVRLERDALLKASDWSQLPDAPGDRKAWAEYRQALRDLTDQPGFPDNIKWPEVPK